MGRTPRKKLDRFLVECPMCGNVPPTLFQDFNGFYYFDCDNKDCKVGKVKIYTKGLTERLEDEKKSKKRLRLPDERKMPKILQEKVKGTNVENVDWKLIGMIVLAVLGMIYILLS